MGIEEGGNAIDKKVSFNLEEKKPKWFNRNKDHRNILKVTGRVDHSERRSFRESMCQTHRPCI